MEFIHSKCASPLVPSAETRIKSFCVWNWFWIRIGHFKNFYSTRAPFEIDELFGWKLSPVVFYHWFRLRNTTWLSLQPNRLLKKNLAKSFLILCADGLQDGAPFDQLSVTWNNPLQIITRHWIFFQLHWQVPLVIYPIMGWKWLKIWIHSTSADK